MLALMIVTLVIFQSLMTQYIYEGYCRDNKSDQLTPVKLQCVPVFNLYGRPPRQISTETRDGEISYHILKKGSQQ